MVVGRGGLLKPIKSGVYEITEKMKEDLYESPFGEHASNLGGLIADDISKNLPSTRAFIVDPVVVDELEDVARISGHPLLNRVSIFHALNQKAVARKHAKAVSKNYEDLNLIVCICSDQPKEKSIHTLNHELLNIYKPIISRKVSTHYD